MGSDEKCFKTTVLFRKTHLSIAAVMLQNSAIHFLGAITARFEVCFTNWKLDTTSNQRVKLRRLCDNRYRYGNQLNTAPIFR